MANIEDFINGKASLDIETGEILLLPRLGRCGMCGVPIAEIVSPFRVGDEVIYDHVFGSFGRGIGVGIVQEINENTFLVEIESGVSTWFHHCELTKAG